MAASGASFRQVLQGLPLASRWRLFRSLEALSHARSKVRESFSGHQPRQEPFSLPDKINTTCYWFFISTIGELNAIEPFLRELQQREPAAQLLLLTDHGHYVPAYKKAYPKASVVAINGHSNEVQQLLNRCPPAALFVAEIPARLSDAPCRFPFAALRYVKRAGVPVLLINGWLYGGGPSCSIDEWERDLFDTSYIELFDHQLVQTEAVKNQLLALGADPSSLSVMGNMKFDSAMSMSQQHDVSIAPNLRFLLAELSKDERPILVIGSVSESEDQARVFKAVTAVRQDHPDLRVVLAPRHPEFPDRMRDLKAVLDQTGLRQQWRSQMGSTEPELDWDVLVLDSVGELKSFYSIADVAYVGTDHNLLEPLSFGVPVATEGQWEKRYPSYPVYEQLRGFAWLFEGDGTVRTLARFWCDQLLVRHQTSTEERQQKVLKALSEHAGATAECFNRLTALGFLNKPA